jgi:hypothetical protein
MIAMPPLFASVWNTYVKDAVPIVAAIIAALVGGISSGFFVHWLTRSREQEASVRDSDKEEWRELLSALTKIEMYEADRNIRSGFQ